MNATTTTTSLDRSRSLRLLGAHRVWAKRGSLWVTRDGEIDDLVLEEGSSVLLDGSTPALVTALGDRACAATTALARPAWPRRAMHGLRQRAQQWWRTHGWAHAPVST